MALNVKFLKGTAAQYAAATKDVNTFYYTTDDSKVYLGTIELSSGAVDAKIDELVQEVGSLSSLTTETKSSIVAAINELVTDLNAANGSISDLEDAMGDISDLETTADTVVGAINEVKDAVDTLETASAVTVEVKGTANEGYLKTYVVKQGDSSVGEIDIPKDLVVTAGEIVNNPEGQPAGKYLKLTIANQTAPVYINVKDLVDVYTAQATAAQVQLAISATNEISATIVAKSIGTTELADKAVTAAKLGDEAVETAKIKDEAVTEAKLAKAVADKLNAGDSALQKSDITTGSANGTISVGGDDVAVKGLGSAAYTDSTAYDAAGAANTVKTTLEGTASDTKDSTTIAGAKKYADDKASTAEQNAKDYADGLASDYATAAQGTKADSAVQNLAEGTTNGTIKVTKGGVADFEVAVHGLKSAAYTESSAYDASGSAATAESNAKAYTDTALTWGTIA